MNPPSLARSPLCHFLRGFHPTRLRLALSHHVGDRALKMDWTRLSRRSANSLLK